MTDMSDGLSWTIAIVTTLNILAMAWLIWWSAKGTYEKSGEDTGHVWDGDVKEANNPLPRWWLWLFYGTMIFGFIYFALYGGLGKIQGVLGWSQEKQWREEVERAEEKYGPIFAHYANMDLETLAKDSGGREIGQRLYLNNCAVCHGSDAAGARGFPDLTDDAWQWGGDPQQIKQSILNGRQAQMPPMAAAVGGEEGAELVARYVLSLSGRDAGLSESELDQAKAKFASCAGCHGQQGKGNPALGAPNLTDDAWLYGASVGAIKEAIVNGRNGVMPAFEETLGPDKVHVVAGYVYGLSKD